MNSVSRKLTISLIGVLVFLFCLFSMVMQFSAKRALENQLEDVLKQKLSTIIPKIEQRNGDLRVHIREASQNELQPFWFEFNAHNAKSALEVWDAEKNVICRLGGVALADKNVFENGSLGKPVFWNTRLASGAPARAIGVRFKPRLDEFHDPNSETTEAFLVVATNRESLDASILEQEIIMLLAALGLVIIIIIVVPYILRRGLKPLKILKERGEMIDARSLSERFPLEGMPSELVPICDCLNKLLSRIEASFEREHRFGSDVAHELCTPLAELRLLLEYSLKFSDSNHIQCIEQSHDVLLKLENIVLTLLDLYRAEQHGGYQTLKEHQPIVPLIQSLWDSMKPRAAERRLTLCIEVPIETKLTINPVLFTTMVSNLLDNAIEYADTDSEIRISFTQKDACFELAISNQSSRLLPADIDCMFDRFWRKDVARSESRHSGLGLPLVKEIASGMGFSLIAKLDPDTLFSIIITDDPAASKLPSL